MSQIIQVQSGQSNVQTPDGILRGQLEKALVTDEQFDRLSADSFTSVLTDLGPGILASVVSLAGITEDDQLVATFTPGFAGRIKNFCALTTVAATTASKAASIGVWIDKAQGTTEVQRLTPQNTPTGGTFTLTFDGQTTSTIAYNASAATIQTALEALSNIMPGDVTCTGGPINSAYVVVTFGGLLAGTDVPLMTVNNAGLTNATSVTLTPSTQTAGAAAVNEVQIITPGGTISGGDYTVTYSGQTTAAIAFDANAAAIQAALEALSNIAPGDVTVTGGPISSGVVTLTFGGTLAGTNLTEITCNGGGLTGAAPTITPSTTTPGSPAVNEVQRITPANSPTGGTYTITYSGQTTAAIPFDAVAADVQDALSALSNLATDAVVVTDGPISTSYLTLTFSGSGVAATNVDQVTCSAVNLTNATEPNVLVTTTTAGAAGDFDPVQLSTTLSLTTAKCNAAGNIVPASNVPAGSTGLTDFSADSRITLRTTAAPTDFSEGYVAFLLFVEPYRV